MEIVLIRHGRPTGAQNPVLSASGFARWVREYNRSRVHSESLPPDDLKGAFAECLVLSSDLPRAVHSAELCIGRYPDRTLAELREMEIPRFRMPFRLSAYSWVYLNRAMWMVGRRGPFESFAVAKTRASKAATRLEQLAHAHGRVVVFGHGMLNRHIRAHLVSVGWQLTSDGGAGYWSSATLSKPDPK
jgi:broad specificity phosphatase PhoE